MGEERSCCKEAWQWSQVAKGHQCPASLTPTVLLSRLVGKRCFCWARKSSPAPFSSDTWGSTASSSWAWFHHTGESTFPAQAGWGAGAFLSPPWAQLPHGTARRCLTHGTASTKQLRCRALQPQQQSNIQNDSLDTCSSVGTWQKAQYLCLSALYELVSSSKSLPFISIRVFSTLYTSATMVLKQKEHSH